MGDSQSKNAAITGEGCSRSPADAWRSFQRQPLAAATKTAPSSSTSTSTSTATATANNIMEMTCITAGSSTVTTKTTKGQAAATETAADAADPTGATGHPPLSVVMGTTEEDNGKKLPIAKRKRGRPRKDPPRDALPKRPRGRPRKHRSKTKDMRKGAQTAYNGFFRQERENKVSAESLPADSHYPTRLKEHWLETQTEVQEGTISVIDSVDAGSKEQRPMGKEASLSSLEQVRLPKRWGLRRGSARPISSLKQQPENPNKKNPSDIEKKIQKRKSRRPAGATTTKSKGDQNHCTPAATLVLPQLKRVTKTSRSGRGSDGGHGGDGCWWKTEPVPSIARVWPFLQTLGFSRDGGDARAGARYMLPDWVQPIPSRILFCSDTGLRRFLCAYGIPDKNNLVSRELEPDQYEQLRRWIAFANVPASSVQKLRNMSRPRNFDDLCRLLSSTVPPFRNCNGRIYVPDASDHCEQDGRTRFQRLVHYFEKDDIYDEQEDYFKPSFRCYCRGSWQWGYEAGSAKKKDKEIQLRLWAAVSSQPLPKFTGLPPQGDLERLQKMKSG